MSELRVLSELGWELDRAIAREPRVGTPRPRVAIAVALAALVIGGGVAGATGLLPFGSAVRGPSPGEVPLRLAPTPGSATVLPMRVADPYGGDPWALRVARTASGGVCVAAAHVRDGRFGRTGTDGRFHELPLVGTGTCSDARTDSVVFDVAVARDPHRRVTVISGKGGAALDRIEVPAARVAQANGAFLAVLAGNQTETLRVVAHFKDGTTRTLYEPKGDSNP